MSENNIQSKEHLEYLKDLRKKRILINVVRIGLLLALLIFWEIAAANKWIDSFITSSPSRIWTTLSNLNASGELWKHIGATLFETIVGFILGSVAGLAIAVLLWWSNTLSKVLDPYLVVLNSLPKVALGPIIIVWVGAGEPAIIVMALLISLIVTIMTVLNGFLEVSEAKIMLMCTFGATKKQILTKVVLPASVPTMISALKINVGMTWVGVIMGEFLVSKAGLGYLIVYGSQVFKLDLVMASVVVLCLAAALMYIGVARVEAKYVKWKK